MLKYLKTTILNIIVIYLNFINFEALSLYIHTTFIFLRINWNTYAFSNITRHFLLPLCLNAELCLYVCL